MKKTITLSKSNNYIFYGSLSISVILLIIIILINQGTFAIGDGISHYLISRYSWQHPELFLNHWGKPIYTLLTSPFSQFGFEGVMFFNLIIYVLNTLAIKQIFEKIFPNGNTFSFTVPFLLISPYVYNSGILGGYTEILFSFIVILAILAFVKEKYILSAIIISFLPFSRPEYVVIVPLFAILFIYRKKYYQLLFFLFAFIIYSFIGMFHFHDFFWFITTNPYKGKAAIYGSGSLWHFVSNYRKIFGLSETILILTSLITFIFVMFKEKWKENYLDLLFLVAIGGFLGVFTVHSYLWYKGLHASFGLIRVIATITPLTILIIGFLFQKFIEFKKIKKHKILIIGLISLIAFVDIFSQKYYPIKYNLEAQTLKNSNDWIKAQNLKYNRVVFLNSLIAKEMNIDIFDNKKSLLLWSINRAKPINNSLKNGDLIIWDSHHGPNEGRTKLDSLVYNHKTKLLNYFLPTIRQTTLGGYEFGVFIFTYDETNNNITVIDTINLSKTTINLDSHKFLERHNFEDSIKKIYKNGIIRINAIFNSKKEIKNLFFVAEVSKNKEKIYKATLPISEKSDTINFILPQFEDGMNYKFYIYNPKKQNDMRIKSKIDLIIINKIPE